MFDEIKGYPVTIFLIGVLILLIGFLGWLLYQDGAGKAQYLRERKNIEMPWYRAIHMPDEVFVDANINLENQKK